VRTRLLLDVIFYPVLSLTHVIDFQMSLSYHYRAPGRCHPRLPRADE